MFVGSDRWATCSTEVTATDGTKPLVEPPLPSTSDHATQVFAGNGRHRTGTHSRVSITRVGSQTLTHGRREVVGAGQRFSFRTAVPRC